MEFLVQKGDTGNPPRAWLRFTDVYKAKMIFYCDSENSPPCPMIDVINYQFDIEDSEHPEKCTKDPKMRY